jgi:hypothetical protein
MNACGRSITHTAIKLVTHATTALLAIAIPMTAGQPDALLYIASFLPSSHLHCNSDYHHISMGQRLPKPLDSMPHQDQ